MGTIPTGPPNKFNHANNISEMTGIQVLNLLNKLADEGDNTFIIADLVDGLWLFGGSYSN
jgi:hypothetical protein